MRKQKTVLMLLWIVWNRTVDMYKMDLAWNNLQWSICQKHKLNETKTCSISQHREIHSGPSTKKWKILREKIFILSKAKDKEKLQILESLYLNINKPSLDKINFEYSSNIQTGLSHISYQFFILPLSKNFFFLFFSFSLYECIWFVIIFVVSLFAF